MSSTEGNFFETESRKQEGFIDESMMTYSWKAWDVGTSKVISPQDESMKVKFSKLAKS